jgi:lipid-A-disaccharide synthase
MNKSIFLIAGEKSGDDLGFRLMVEIQKATTSIKFHGIGGPLMQSCGLTSLFPYETLSVMGFVEILPKIFELKAKINQTAEAILKLKPDLVITIDLPGFNYRVVKLLRDRGYSGKIFHYVAPTVWAYKENRASKFAKIFDRMICILPHEPPYFKKYDLITDYIGNPVIEQNPQINREIKDEVRKILICCGSRIIEIQRLMPIFSQALNALAQQYNFEAIILTHSSNTDLIGKILQNAEFKYKISTPEYAEKIKIIANCDLALSKSGTITTEIALAGVPMIVAHKINWLSYIIIKSMIKISSICLVNIIANKQIIPELIQGNCTAETIRDSLAEYITNPKMRKEQVKNASKIFKLLGLGKQPSPSQKLCSIILNALK